MKVTISVGGKFHAFYLAQQLQKRGYLERLITSYPKHSALKEGISGASIVSLPLKEIIERGYKNLPFLPRSLNLQHYTHNFFDKQASRYLRPCDIFVGWSSFSLYTLRKAKSQGTLTIIERGSSHIEYQRDILKEEYGQLGIKPCLPEPRIVEKELREYQEADYISIPSLYVKKTFLEKGVPEDKLIHVPYGVDINAFKPIIKKDKIFRLIYVGQISIRKGIHYLLKAVSELKFKNLELWLIGNMTGEIRPFLRKYKGYFKYLGVINYYQLYKYYSQGSVFVLPSIEEGLSLVLLQAMACGLPVICTTNTGAEDIIDDNIDGFIIPIRDTAALKQKISCLYENSDICQEMGRRALEKATHNSSWDNYGDKIVRAYLRLLKLK